ncbi:TetR/AcrR family transcriptional regulator [Agrococcus beijingensis]|uniref:TetR/AcrR family transcriptional regulator n=1 Tax=Agrococcus beijingensis TaxID=3068634 RepID=UPI002741571B|nr:TetR/AcrR family transcriptional regulator [Agrococcus sp. REN33]
MARVASGTVRAQLLDAYESLLIEGGERAATVQAVADRAGVSKGGLLYHFGSKAALEAGLIERLDELGAADIQALREADDMVETFLRTSVASGSPLDRAIVAVVRLAQAPSGALARAALQRQDDDYAAALTERLGDEELALAIVLLSDGVYLRSALGALEAQRAGDEVEVLLRIARRLGA